MYQANRLIKIKTPLADDVLLATSLTGSDQLFGGFCFVLEMISTEKSILPKQLLQQPIAIEVTQAGVSRYFHGVVSLFELGHKDGHFYHYLAEVRPQLWMLSHSKNYCIFQQKSVPDILKTILHDAGIVAIDFRLKRTYSPREYCCQYGEDTLAFIHRLLEEEGIFYFYEHSVNQHTLVFVDGVIDFPNVKKTVGIDPRADFAHWYQREAIQAGKIVLSDYHYEKPGTQLQVTSAQANNRYEIHHYPGNFSNTATGEKQLHLHKAAQEHAALVMGGQCDDLFFAPGKSFVSGGEKYYLLNVQYHVQDKSYFSQGSQSQQVIFTCAPIKSPFHAGKSTAKPKVIGVDTAVVVGEEGSDIFTDHLGRVKVKFHWERGNNCSCWLRVAQLWAGNGFGTQFLPRLGQEVVVQFIHGDPDRPLIMGSLFNADHALPFKLPGEQTRSGIKTRSLQSGQVGNELSFDDAKGSEQVLLHAQKDFKRVVENNELCLVKKGNLDISILEGETLISAKKKITFKVGDSKIELGEDLLSIFAKKVSIK